MEIATKLNPRFVHQPISREDPPNTGPIVAVCDCPCPCGRSQNMPELKGILDYPTTIVEYKTNEWKALLANYTIDSVVHRSLPFANPPCGWDGFFRNGEVVDVDGRKKSDAKVADPQGVLARGEERRRARKEAESAPKEVRGRRN